MDNLASTCFFVMKRLIFFTSAFFLCTAIFLSFSYFSKPIPANGPLIGYAPELIRPIPSVTQSVGVPLTLTIPSIGVTAPVEQVGLDDKKAMDVPKNVDGVGWYNLGTKPGDLGSAVVAGHMDKVTGEPAVFYDLEKVKIGDEILVMDEKQIQYRFKVTGSYSFPFDKLPLTEIFASTDKSRLNLITCGGEWDAKKKNYSNRLVVYTELVQ